MPTGPPPNLSDHGGQAACVHHVQSQSVDLEHRHARRRLRADLSRLAHLGVARTRRSSRLAIRGVPRGAAGDLARAVRIQRRVSSFAERVTIAEISDSL